MEINKNFYIFAGQPNTLPMIKLRHLLVFVCIIVAHSAVSQSGLNVKGVSPDLHLSHTISGKDTWYSLGRLYNINPKEAASYNGTTIDKPLSLGTEIKIPLSNSNFSQNGTKNPDEVFVPVYHTVQPKEWMYRISVNHNKVPIETLEKWNNISRDNATAGTRLIVGFLKVKQGQSSLASGAVNNNSTVPAVATTPASTQRNEDVTKKTEAPKSPEVTKKEEPVNKLEPPLITEVPKKEAPDTKATANVNYKGGYFKNLYDASGKSASGYRL